MPPERYIKIPLSELSQFTRVPKETSPLPRPREREGAVALDTARELMGAGSFFGPEAVETTFGGALAETDIPSIPFSRAELEHAKEQGSYLILRIDKDKDGHPLTPKAMYERCQPLLSQEKKGKALYSVDWYKDDPVYTAETCRSGWALVSKEPVQGSTNKNCLEQTQRIIDYLQNTVFKTGGIPKDYQDAIDEFERDKPIIEPLVTSDWKNAAEKLALLKMSELTRQRFSEAFSDILTIALNTTDTRLLESLYTWTSSRSSSGYLVSVGDAGSDGASVLRRWAPDARHSILGVLLARRGPGVSS